MAVESLKAIRSDFIVSASLGLNQCFSVSTCTDVNETIAAPVTVGNEAFNGYWMVDHG
jgi:hypothetical protein